MFRAIFFFFLRHNRWDRISRNTYTYIFAINYYRRQFSIGLSIVGSNRFDLNLILILDLLNLYKLKQLNVTYIYVYIILYYIISILYIVWTFFVFHLFTDILLTSLYNEARRLLIDKCNLCPPNCSLFEK